MSEPDAIDIGARDFFTDESLLGDPYPYYESLRGQCPVHREPHHGVVAITGYDEALHVYNDSVAFSACNSPSGPFPGFPVPLEGDDVSDIIEKYRHQLPLGVDLPTLDPPQHTRARGLMLRLLTPKRLKENEEYVGRLADRMLDDIVPRGECEFIGAFADPYTCLVIADLLGVPEPDRLPLLEKRKAQVTRAGAVGADAKALPPNHLAYLFDAFTSYVEERRREPRNDVLTGLATATYPDGSTPSVVDVVRTAAFLFVAGQETTVRMLGFALQFLAERPDLQELLRKERDRIPNFIEETLRVESPIKSNFRMARVPTNVAGVDVPAGTTVMFLNGAVNRDPRHFEHPHTFDVDRANARHHLAFGQGIHTCPGAPLARAEGRIAIERILDRTADIRISERAHGPVGARRHEHSPSYLFRGLSNLHLEITPAGPKGG
ncbi:MAG TPA: cytochrome P450 [Acidimicrobiales bacterium]|nr:cytochrome P450 [Acidimicrobiales bacterium]